MREVQEADEHNANYRTATILTMIANAFRGPNQRAYQVSDFLAEPVPSKPADPDQLLEELRHWNAQMGGEEIIR